MITTENSPYLKRGNFTQIIKNTSSWDLIIIGGGATGLGIALDAASRGYRTLLLERNDFSHGTSSRSTKLAHGGVRYLAQGNIQLVFEALKERGLLIKNAPHLVHQQAFVIPSYRWWEKFFYGIGLKIYDKMSMKYRLGKTKLISKKEINSLFDNLKIENLNGGVQYFDGQFDDARMAINLAQTAAKQGGVLLNYCEVENLIIENNKIVGVSAKDKINGERYSLKAKTVINAAGVFADSILKLNDPFKNPILKVSQGVHLILDRQFLKGNHALMIPKTKDGRVLFLVPWKNFLLVGTTDTALDAPTDQPKALNEEIDFILETIERYLIKKPVKEDILSVFAGLRPLVLPDKNQTTKQISRDHKIYVEPSGLISIIGGKWTTYRKMAEDVLKQAIKNGDLEPKNCITETIMIHGSENFSPESNEQNAFGSDVENINLLMKENERFKELLHPKFPYTHAEIIWSVRNEMALNIEDILARRLRILFLDAHVAISIAPKVANIMAQELNKDKSWEHQQIEEFNRIAQDFLP